MELGLTVLSRCMAATMVLVFSLKYSSGRTESSTRSIWETALKKPVLITGVVVGVVIRSVEWYDLAKIKPTLLMAPSLAIKWKLHCRSRKQKRKNKPMTMFDSEPCDLLVLPLLLSTPTTQFSLGRKRRSCKPSRKKWKRSDSVQLMTPLTTPTFDFHWVIRPLTTPIPTPIPTPSLVKTSLNRTDRTHMKKVPA